jgi:ABC-type sulfate transport system permease component
LKRTIIGGFLSLLGTIWELAIIIVVGNNLVSGWPTPPGRFFTTITETGMTFPMIVASVLLAMGLLIMGIEYFKKDTY